MRTVCLNVMSSNHPCFALRNNDLYTVSFHGRVGTAAEALRIHDCYAEPCHSTQSYSQKQHKSSTKATNRCTNQLLSRCISLLQDELPTVKANGGMPSRDGNILNHYTTLMTPAYLESFFGKGYNMKSTSGVLMRITHLLHMLQNEGCPPHPHRGTSEARGHPWPRRR